MNSQINANTESDSPYQPPTRANLLAAGWSPQVWGVMAVVCAIASAVMLRFVESNARVLPNGTRIVDARLETALGSLLLGLVAFAAFVMVHRRGQPVWRRWQSAILLIVALLAAIPGLLAGWWYVVPFVNAFL